MANAAALVHCIFRAPGGSRYNTREILERAAAAHAELLLQAHGELGRPLANLLALVSSGASASKYRLLCDPLLVEAMHTLAPFSANLERWHNSVAAPGPPGRAPPADRAALDNIDLVLLLRNQRQWLGEHDLCTDVLGRLAFPFSDWTLILQTERQDDLGCQRVVLSLEAEQACWRLGDRDPPFLTMSHDDCLRMLVDNVEPVDRRRLTFPHPHVRTRLQCAPRVGHSRVHYDAVAFQNFQAHAALTGGLVADVLAAMRGNSPAIYREFKAFIHAVRGFEFPTLAQGVVGAFSDPTLPGIMSINVPYSPEDDPCIDALCFTWFGHELGHTKDYLIDTILYQEGVTLLRNAAEWTPPIPRYGRALSVRTLFQVPYVHLYEWILLMDFFEAGFWGLPWVVAADVAAVGDDLATEICEAFALIDEVALPTPAGVAALVDFREMFAMAQARWRRLRPGGAIMN
ncbi:MAG TPA: hypothetical protein VE988_16565 [Gemmataceae bacterium]|nr:hypothetical protein [Gemmataceae bacterium]